VSVEDADRDRTGGTEKRADGEPSDATQWRERIVYWLRVIVYTLGFLVGLSLLTVGTIAVIAEAKGTWHWQIHLETTVAYTAVFVVYLLAALAPSAAVLALARWRWSV
jgi:hypothetical protein